MSNERVIELRTRGASEPREQFEVRRNSPFASACLLATACLRQAGGETASHRLRPRMENCGMNGASSYGGFLKGLSIER